MKTRSVLLAVIYLTVVALVSVTCTRTPTAPSVLGESRQNPVPLGSPLEMYSSTGAYALTVMEANLQPHNSDVGQALCVRVRVRAIEHAEYFSFDFKVVGTEDSPQYEMPYWRKEMAPGATSDEEYCFDIGQDDSRQFFILWNPSVSDPRYFALQ